MTSMFFPASFVLTKWKLRNVIGINAVIILRRHWTPSTCQLLRRVKTTTAQSRNSAFYCRDDTLCSFKTHPVYRGKRTKWMEDPTHCFPRFIFPRRNTQNSFSSSAQTLPMKTYTVYKKLVAGRKVQLLLNYFLENLFVKSYIENKKKTISGIFGIWAAFQKCQYLLHNRSQNPRCRGTLLENQWSH